MKILLLTRSLQTGGAERQLVQLAIGLKTNGHDVKVAVFYSGGVFESDLYHAGVPLLFLNKTGRWNVFSFFCRFINEIWHDPPEILYSFLSVPNIISVLVRPVIPKIKIIWGIRASDMDLCRYNWLAKVEFVLCRYLSIFAHLIIFNSSAGMNYHQQHGFSSSNMTVIPNGIDTNRFRPDVKARQRIRKEFDINEGAILIGMIGRLDPMKDHPTFLQAASLVCKKKHDVIFICVGDGNDAMFPVLQSHDETARRLIWAGNRTDMEAIYNGLDILCSSSAYGEGFPNVIAEAMACGVPCVVTEVGDSPFIVGRWGEVAPPQNIEALATSIMNMISRLTNETDLKMHARNHIKSDYNIALMIERTCGQIQALL